MRIRIIGAGVMGSGIAQWAAAAGHAVELADVRREAVDDALERIAGILRRAVAKGRLGPGDAEATQDRIVAVDDPVGSGQPDLVIEAVREDLETKAELFTALEQKLPASTIFATNTSSLSVTRIGARLADPGRFAGLHFFNPAPLMRVVEIVPGLGTRQDVVDRLTEFVDATGHRAVVVADSPGFLINHAGRGLVTEALALLEENVAPPAEIDLIARDVLGLRMGPFELMDLTGLDVTSAVITTIWEGFAYSDRLRPSYLTANRVAAGLHGRKTGRGWYDHRSGPSGPEPVRYQAGNADRPVWMYGSGDCAAALADTGVTVVPELTEDTLAVVPTWGTTVAAAVAEHGLPAARAVGVDPLSLDRHRRVLAVTPATEPAAARDAVAVLARGEHEVSVVRDTAGGVAQRLVSSIVSVAASIAERGLAGPADIDAAVTAGLGYPRGPLSWGQEIGPARMLDLQRNLFASTEDPRYRPTRWLTERAQLDLPLTAEGFDPTTLYR